MKVMRERWGRRKEVEEGKRRRKNKTQKKKHIGFQSAR